MHSKLLRNQDRIWRARVSIKTVIECAIVLGALLKVLEVLGGSRVHHIIPNHHCPFSDSSVALD